MIRGHVALLRQLRSFMESSGLPWSIVELRHERNEDGRILTDDTRAEISFPYHGQIVDVVIYAPSTDKVDGVESFPLGKLAARTDDGIVKGPIDPATWNQILEMVSK